MNGAELRKRREQMGLCTKCGGLKSNPHWNWCEKCRVENRERYLTRTAGSYAHIPAKAKEPEVKKEHKCWTCEWAKFLGDRFFCPFVEGTCVKEDKE